MLTLLSGGPGAGKTFRVLEEIKSRLSLQGRAFLVVPDQGTVEAEKKAAALLPPSAPLSFEVTNLPRLANTAFRTVGGAGRRSADAATRQLLIWLSLHRILPLLSDKRRLDAGRVTEVSSLVRELESDRISPLLLDRAARTLGDGALKRKLTDYALILTEYRAVCEEYRTMTPEAEEARLIAILEKNNPFAGDDFYFDGFHSFTAGQYQIMEALLASSDVTVTLALGEEAAASSAYAELLDTKERLIALAKKLGCEVKEEHLPGNRRVRSPYLASLAEGIFRTPKRKPEAPADSSLRIMECPHPFKEVEFVAADLSRRIREGARYRDFAIVARHAESYRGILDTALENAEIPFFFSLPTALNTTEGAKLILAAYGAVTGGFRREDVLLFAKCGLPTLDRASIEAFELYTESWQLSGHKLISDAPLVLSPKGYSTPRNAAEREKNEALLTSINLTREAISRPLRILTKKSKGMFTIREHSETLYEFLSEIGLERALLEKAELCRRRGRQAEGDILSRLTETLYAILDNMVLLLGDVSLSMKDYAALLSIELSSHSLASIPQSRDSVTVGDADLLRTDGLKYVYLLGMNRGVFPSPVSDSALFSPAEEAALSSLGITVGRDPILSASHEYHAILRSLLSSEEGVTLTYYRSGFAFEEAAPSPVIKSLLALGGDGLRQERTEELPWEESIYTRGMAFSHLYDPGPAGGKLSLRTLLTENEEGDERVAVLDRLAVGERPLVQRELTLEPSLMDALFPRDIRMTETRFRAYTDCPYSYFCRYFLKTERDQRIGVGAGDMGNFIHSLLERFFTYIREQKLSLDSLKDEEISTLLDRMAEEYLRSILPGGRFESRRVRAIFDRLREKALATVREVTEELSSGQFLPRFFEMETGKDEESASPLKMALPDGTPLIFNGTVDRVDTYRHGKNVYLRVVDYKTGNASFDRREIRAGKHLQALLYLFTLWKSDKPGFLRALGCEEGGVLLPAGALYLKIDLNEERLPRLGTVPEEGAGFQRFGLFLEDEISLSAMEGPKSERFLPLKRKADGEYDKASEKKLVTLEGMEELLGEVTGVLTEICTSLRGGEASPSPDYGGDGRCSYCSYRPLCRMLDGGERE